MSPFLWREAPSETIASFQPSPKARANPGEHSRAKRPVEQLTSDGEFVRRFPSISEAAVASCTPGPNIVRAATGARKTAGGYRWRYVEVVA